MPYAYEPYEMSVTKISRHAWQMFCAMQPVNRIGNKIGSTYCCIVSRYKFTCIRNETMRVSQFLKYDTQLVKLLRQLDGDAYFKAISIS